MHPHERPDLIPPPGLCGKQVPGTQNGDRAEAHQFAASLTKDWHHITYSFNEYTGESRFLVGTYNDADYFRESVYMMIDQIDPVVIYNSARNMLREDGTIVLTGFNRYGYTDDYSAYRHGDTFMRYTNLVSYRENSEQIPLLLNYHALRPIRLKTWILLSRGPEPGCSSEFTLKRSQE